MTLIKSNIATEALWYADNANETDQADEADEADEAEQGKKAVGEAVWWCLWLSCLVRLSAKLFGEAVRKAICKADDADEADDADQV